MNQAPLLLNLAAFSAPQLQTLGGLGLIMVGMMILVVTAYKPYEFWQHPYIRALRYRCGNVITDGLCFLLGVGTIMLGTLFLLAGLAMRP